MGTVILPSMIASAICPMTCGAAACTRTVIPLWSWSCRCSVESIPSPSVQTSPLKAGAKTGVRTVRLDDTAAATMATRRLLELGHRQVAFVGAEGATSDRRHRGYLDALDEAGVAAMPMIAGGWEANSARNGIDRYFAAGGRATALVVVTPTSALGVAGHDVVDTERG